MTEFTKQSILNHLNKLKTYGFNYHENVNININQKVSNFSLPNDLSKIENIAKNCHLCQNSKTRKNVLFSQGNENSNVMFIFDEPSTSEDDTGNFNEGKSGEMIVKMITNVLKLRLEDVYTTTLVKCKSNDNLKYSDYEICSSYLDKQIQIVNPKIIVLFGERTYNFFTKNDDFFKIRGKEFQYENSLVLATYAPSFLLRNPSYKKDSYLDILRVKTIMES